jgi:magnesium chelatase family protein
MQIIVPRLSPHHLLETQIQPSENSAIVQARVIQAHSYQRSRQSSANAALTVKELNRVALLEPGAQQLLNKVMEKFNFSARSYHRIIKIARTIADLAENPTITKEHLSEAINYRYWDKSSA